MYLHKKLGCDDSSTIIQLPLQIKDVARSRVYKQLLNGESLLTICQTDFNQSGSNIFIRPFRFAKFCLHSLMYLHIPIMCEL